jgi:hypothetical protein
MTGIFVAHVGMICLVNIDGIIAVGGLLQELGNYAKGENNCGWGYESW